jgi:predicted DNA-binding transcriptional regulator YafY
MPVNRNALIRYRTIDNCLQNRQRRWTLDDLIDACAEALYEYEGIDKGVSRRSIQMDIQMMRSDKLGYNAPIIVLEKKYYTYDDPNYSITNIPLTDQDLTKLTEVVEILRQFKGFSHFQELSGMVQRLESKIHSAKTKQEPIIDFEKNENLKGLEHIEAIYQSIVKKQTIDITYQSFKARSANNFTFHPYSLKEYRNRWFVIGTKNKDKAIMNLALDRILSIQPSTSKYFINKQFNVGEYFQNIIGVTLNPNEKIEKVIFFADKQTAPYIITKPLHHSQQLMETLPHGSVFSIQVQINFELEREILGFGDRIKILSPDILKRKIKEVFQNALDQYQYELSNSYLEKLLLKLSSKGTVIIKHIYSKKEINQIKNIVYQFQKENTEEKPYAIRNLLSKIPGLVPHIINKNLSFILNRIDKNLFLTKAIFFDKTHEANWYVTWHQDKTINVKEKIETEGFTGWTKKEDHYGVTPTESILKNTITIRIHLDETTTKNGALMVIPGSHNKKLNDEEIKLITQNSMALNCELDFGDIHLLKPLLLHASHKSVNEKSRRVIHLEFNSVELPNQLWWAEFLRIQSD